MADAALVRRCGADKNRFTVFADAAPVIVVSMPVDEAGLVAELINPDAPVLSEGESG